MESFTQWFSQLQWGKLLVMALSAASCIVCIVLHELCHGLAALWMGDDTARRAGRLSLNPLKHIDPVGLVLLFTVHFGWAKPVPVNYRRFKNPKLGMALTALAGPLGNLLLALMLTPVYAVVFAWYQTGGPATVYYLAVFLLTTITLSIGLAVFNLFPIPPLDGFHVVNNILLKGRVPLNQTAFQILRIGLLVLMLTGVLSQALSFCVVNGYDIVLRFCLILTGQSV